MTDYAGIPGTFSGDWREQTKHGTNPDGSGRYGIPPLPSCDCIVCRVTRARMEWCFACQNTGASPYCGSPFGCWVCGRGVWWQRPVTTDDVALGA